MPPLVVEVPVPSLNRACSTKLDGKGGGAMEAVQRDTAAVAATSLLVRAVFHTRANVCTEGKSEPFQMHCVRPPTPSLAITTHPGILR